MNPSQTPQSPHFEVQTIRFLGNDTALEMRTLALLFWTWNLRTQPALSELIVGADLYSCATYFNTPFDNTDGAIVQVQFLDDNPFACGSNMSSFKNKTEVSTTGEPQALLAFAGNCTIKQKVRMTELLSKHHPTLQFLVLIESAARLPGVLNLMLHSQERSDCQTNPKDCHLQTKLHLLSINRDCGDRLLEYISKQSNFTLAKGGPPVFIFSDELDCKWQAIIQLISLMLFSFSGSFLLAHVLFSRLYPGRRHDSGSDDPSNQARRCLLSEATVEQFLNPEAAAALFERNRMGSDDTDWHGPSCAVCLEGIVLPCKVSILPCGHPFHHECIMPWLTERQACCPLCKLVLVGEPTNSTDQEVSIRAEEYSEADAHEPRESWRSWWNGLQLQHFLPVRNAPVMEQAEDLILVEQVASEFAQVEELELTSASM